MPPRKTPMTQTKAKPTPAKRSRRTPAKPADAQPEAQPQPQHANVSVAIDGWLKTLELDELGAARAALARTLAAKLDQALYSDSGPATMAVPGISKELREVLDAIQEASDDSTEFVSGLFAEVGDSAKP